MSAGKKINCSNPNCNRRHAWFIPLKLNEKWLDKGKANLSCMCDKHYNNAIQAIKDLFLPAHIVNIVDENDCG